ncbi:MarR family transcriptional regulator [Guyparkeria halopsychrophila]|uniref:MarR family winged helix-turn-helix transcriptional regulator n=1 Tax=Guyparkeria halopsychrophila TaxID=3139421 RepID=UPI0037CB9115
MTQSPNPVQQREDEITRLVFDVSRLWRVQINKILSEFDLTASAWAVLRILRDEGEGRTQKELAGELAIEGPTLVKLLDGLEKGDWIERRISESDRRAKTIWLKPDAHARIEAADTALAGFRHQVIGELTDEEKRDYMTLSRKVRDLLKSF